MNIMNMNNVLLIYKQINVHNFNYINVKII